MGYAVIRDWLMSIGMLEDTLGGDGKHVKRPTAQGENIGIALDARAGNNGTYFVVVYNLAAQHFIMDNLDAIIEFDQSMQENQGQPWSPEHDRCLLDLHQKGVSVSEIAITLKRNCGAVSRCLKKLGITE